jgi:hypothetical protein
MPVAFVLLKMSPAKYREVLTLVDWFKALRFTTTGAPPARRI